MGIFDSPSDSTEFLTNYLTAPTVYSGDALSIPENLIYGSIAVIGDFAATTWNSLTPKSMEYSTQQLLSNISKDALRIYEENPDTIKTLSFVGGLIAPIGLSIKGMDALRAGVKGANWFSDAGKVERLAEVERAFNAAGPGSTAFKTAKNAVYKATAANMLTDSLAAETAIVLALNEHDYMEDYMQDFGKSFLIGTAFGFGVGGAIGHIIDRGRIAAKIMPIEKELTNILTENVLSPEVLYQGGKQISQRSNSIENLQHVLARNADPEDAYTISDFTKRGIEYVIEKQQAALVDDFSRIWKGGDIINMPVPERDALIKLLDDVRFGEVDSVAYAEVKDVLSKGGTATPDGLDNALSKVANFFTKGKNKAGEEVAKQIDAIYSPIWDRFVSKQDAVNFLTAADTGMDLEAFQKIAKERSKIVGKVIRDEGFTLGIEHSARADQDAIIQFLAVDSKTLEQINKMGVAPDDIATLKALLAKVSKLEDEIGKPVPLTIKLTKEAPSWQAQEKVLLKKAGLDPDYAIKLRALEKQWDAFSLHKHGDRFKGHISYQAEEALRRWIGGDYADMRRAAALLRNQSAIVDGWTPQVRKTAEKYKSYIEEMMNSRQTLELKKALLDFADANGNVWLYRGMRNDPKGHSFLESYTILPKKASEFGAVKLYKVNIDDIIGTVHDFGPTGKKPEILVLPPTRDFGRVSGASDEIPLELVSIEAVEKTKFSGVESAVDTITDSTKLREAVERALLNQVKDLASQGHGIEAIALRTATPEETIKSILAKEWHGGGLLKYSTIADIEMALSPKNRALQLTTNPEKMKQAQLFAKLDAKTTENISAKLIEYYSKSSSSAIVRQLGESLYDDEAKLLISTINEGIQDVTQSGLKYTLLRSVNSVVENFGETGVFAAELGKRVMHVKNQVKEMFEKPLSETMYKIAQNPVDLIEANTLMNAYASADSAVIWKAGQMWTAKGAKSRELIQALNMETEDFLKWAATAADKEGTPMAEVFKYRGTPVKASSPIVNNLMEQFQEYGRHMYELENTRRLATGAGELPDRGMWIPAFSTYNKQYAYVIDMVTKKTSMIYAKDLDDLNQQISAYKASLIGRNPENIRIIPKGSQEEINKILGRVDPYEMSIADINMKHSGASQYTIVPTNTSMLSDALAGYAHHIDNNIDRIVELQLASTMDHLKTLSDLSQQNYSTASLSASEKLKGSKLADPGQVMRNILLGKSNLGEHKVWAEWQQKTSIVTDIALQTIADVLSPVTQMVNKGKVRKATDWDMIAKELESKGIPNPFENLDKSFGRGKYLSDAALAETGLTMRAITLSNSLAATLLLKFMELGQPLVNAISLPILTSGAINRKMAASFAGTTIDPKAKFSVARELFDGVRALNSPKYAHHLAYGEEAGLFKSIISEANTLMSYAKSLKPGPMTLLEDGLERVNKSILVKPAEYSEEMVRKVSFLTGINIAKRYYPGISDTGARIFARNFMDEAIGNYFAPQRPALFHGTLGTAIGLFQTYMVTLAQQLYRGIEGKQWLQLSKQMLTQASIFGASSLPGFHQISNAIALNFSDENWDLQTGTFRAVDDDIANVLLYGMASSLGPGVHTRGDINPRFPNPLTGVDSIAGVNFAMQSYAALERIASAAFTGDEHVGRAMLEAISLQSMSRPLARMAELVNGYSITKSGDKVYGPSEMYLPQSIISRVFATRPLEEIKLREMMHLNTIYGAADFEARRKVTAELKSRAREGTLDQEHYENLMEKYMRTGTSTGWRAAVNKAVAQSNKTGRELILEKMRNGSPLGIMVDDLE